MANWLQEFQAHYRRFRQGQIDEAIFESTDKNILKAASAMFIGIYVQAMPISFLIK